MTDNASSQTSPLQHSAQVEVGSKSNEPVATTHWTHTLFASTPMLGVQTSDPDASNPHALPSRHQLQPLYSASSRLSNKRQRSPDLKTPDTNTAKRKRLSVAWSLVQEPQDNKHRDPEGTQAACGSSSRVSIEHLNVLKGNPGSLELPSSVDYDSSTVAKAFGMFTHSLSSVQETHEYNWGRKARSLAVASYGNQLDSKLALKPVGTYIIRYKEVSIRVSPDGLICASGSDSQGPVSCYACKCPVYEGLYEKPALQHVLETQLQIYATQTSKSVLHCWTKERSRTWTVYRDLRLIHYILESLHRMKLGTYTQPSIRDYFILLYLLETSVTIRVDYKDI